MITIKTEEAGFTPRLKWNGILTQVVYFHHGDMSGYIACINDADIKSHIEGASQVQMNVFNNIKSQLRQLTLGNDDVIEMSLYIPCNWECTISTQYV